MKAGVRQDSCVEMLCNLHMPPRADRARLATAFIEYYLSQGHCRDFSMVSTINKSRLELMANHAFFYKAEETIGFGNK